MDGVYEATFSTCAKYRLHMSQLDDAGRHPSSALSEWQGGMRFCFFCFFFPFSFSIQSNAFPVR